jgi:murein DD-endopeptidase MepM/ murein hydrolase activator NlpD
MQSWLLGNQRFARVCTVVLVAAMAAFGAAHLLAQDRQSNREAAPEPVRLTTHAVLTAIPDRDDFETIAVGSSQSDESSEDTIDPAPDPVAIRTTIDRTTSVKQYLEAAGLDKDEAQQWAELFANAAHTATIRRGRQIALYKDPETGELRGFQYDIDDRMQVEEKGLGGGVVFATQQPIKYYVRPITRVFVLKDSFEHAMAGNRIPKSIADRIEEAFSSRAPTDKLRPGSVFKLLYNEQVSRDGSHLLIGDLQAAELRSGGRTIEAYAFRDEHGRSHLYDGEGKPLGPQFLRFPLPFEYISSGFTNARYHPILHRFRPHVGVDLVAKYGTPVKAVADGKVESADWAGELGRCVRLDHENNLVSIYGHLSRIADDLRAGGYVRMGQVIGYVGTTGLSTGPHLHFAFFKQGQYVNPLTVKLEEGHEIAPRMLGFFAQVKRQYQLALAKLPDLASHFVASSDRKPAISAMGDRYHVRLEGLERVTTMRPRRRRHYRSLGSSLISSGDGRMISGDIPGAL